MLHFCTDTFIVCTLSYIFFFIIYVYVYSGLKMFRRELYTVLLLLFCLAGYPQTGIRLDHRSKPGKSSLLRPEKTVTVRTFGGLKLSGPAFFQPDGRLVVSGKELNPDDVMMISGFVKRNPREKAGGLGLTIGAGAVFPVALFYILGGIAWAMPDGIFVGLTVLAFDLFLAYTGINLMGIYPRRFSTLNWKIVPSATPVGENGAVPIPFPTD